MSPSTQGKLKAKCPQCKSPFLRSTVRKIFCSDKCRYRHRDSQPHRMEYDRQRHREGHAKGVPAYNRPRFPKERAEYYGVSYEPIEPEQVFERDGWVCGICHHPVSKALNYPDPNCASLDHIIPWTAGGAHLLDNVQCSHLVCNLRKGSKVPSSA